MANRSSLIAALDIGTTKVCCFIGHALADGQVRVTGIGHQVSRGMKNGAIVDMEAIEYSIRNAVDSAEKMAGETVREVVVNISSGHIMSHTLSVESQTPGGEIDDADVARVLSLIQKCNLPENRETLHAIPVSYHVDGTTGIREPRGMYGSRLGADIHIVTTQASAMRNLSASVERGHLEVGNFVLSPYASGLACLVEDEIDLGVTCIDIGGGTTTVAVFMQGGFVFSEVIPVGGSHITNDLARGLSTSSQQAERLKTLFGSVVSSVSDERELVPVSRLGEVEIGETNRVPKSVLVGIIKPRVEEIFELARNRLDSAGYDGVAGRRIVLTGGTAQLQGIREFASTLLDRQVRIGKPVRLTGLAEATGGPAFSTCAGLLRYAARGLENGGPEQNGRTENAKRARTSLLGRWMRQG